MALLVLTFGFVLTTVTTSAINRIPIWKSSSLASLLHGLDEGSCQAITAQKLDDMECNAKAYTMAMRRDNARWLLEGRQVQTA